ncbi:hypothetical protein JAAARDRAFT_105030, partial [Jaapia argillacea MUCL 33604]
DSDIPHRTKLARLIIDKFIEEHNKLKCELQNTLGRISFTSDCWSDINLQTHMAISGHWM